MQKSRFLAASVKERETNNGAELRSSVITSQHGEEFHLRRDSVPLQWVGDCASGQAWNIDPHGQRKK